MFLSLKIENIAEEININQISVLKICYPFSLIWDTKIVQSIL